MKSPTQIQKGFRASSYQCVLTFHLPFLLCLAVEMTIVIHYLDSYQLIANFEIRNFGDEPTDF